MPRRRLILPTLFLLLATFVIAVQRDTFIRRRCLPTPSPATRAVGPLDQVIDEFVVDDAHVKNVVRELERRAGVRISIDRLEWSFVANTPTDARRQRPSCTIRQATVEQLLSRILAPFMLFYKLDDPFTTGADGIVNFRAPTTGARQTVIRVHGVDPILLRPDVQWTAFPWMPDYRGNGWIREIHWLTFRHVATGKGQVDPVLRFGDKLIVLTSPRSHWLIDQILHEEAEAQRANRNHPAATRPAQ